MKNKNEKSKNETKDIQKDSRMDNPQHLHNTTNSSSKTLHITALAQMTPEKLYREFIKASDSEKIKLLQNKKTREKLLKYKAT